MLLDECVPRRLKRDFERFDISTVKDAGFLGLKNGNLIKAAQGNFEVLITVDKNIQHQQNRSELSIAIIILSAFTNRYESLSPLVSRAIQELESIRVGEIVTVGD